MGTAIFIRDGQSIARESARGKKELGHEKAQKAQEKSFLFLLCLFVALEICVVTRALIR